MRALIRFSVEMEPNGALRNKLANHLTRAGFARGANTATWEHGKINEGDLAAALGTFWRFAHRHTGPGVIDHFWLYSDR